MGVGRRTEDGLGASLHFDIFSKKKVVFLFLSEKKQTSLLLPPLEKFWKNPLVPPPGKILPTPMRASSFYLA